MAYSDRITVIDQHGAVLAAIDDLGSTVADLMQRARDAVRETGRVVPVSGAQTELRPDGTIAIHVEPRPHYTLLSLYSGDRLLTYGRPKTLPGRIDPSDDAAVVRWAKRAWRGWRRAGATRVGVFQINPNRGERFLTLDAHLNGTANSAPKE